MARVRCAIYTRKSSEDGLEQDFNSLDAQREACEAYIASQRHEGWEALPGRYDDGGISGGHMNRPALQRLMQAVDEKCVDQIVVYKIDRLTRSLADFAKLVERLDAAGASFVSVTQSFNTASSMGRLTLNVLLSFAQFEREVTAERIRDKIAASKRKGLWMGGSVPLGYRADGRSLRIDDGEAEIVRTLYALYLEHSNIRLVQERAEYLGLRSRRRDDDGRAAEGKPFTQSHIHYMLSNPTYAGRIRHKRQTHDGQHPALIDPQVWDKVQKLLSDGAAKPRGVQRKTATPLLAGKLFDETGDRLTPSHSRKNGKRLRYYISRRLVTDRRQSHADAWRLPADQVETHIREAIMRRFTDAGIATMLSRGTSAAEMIQAAERVKAIGDTSECLALVARADLRPGSVTVTLNAEVLARAIGCTPEHIEPDGLTFEAPFRPRRRGVELKLHLGEAPPEIDQKLVANIVKAQRWLAMLINGQTFAEIAEVESTSRRRVQDLVDLALLAPDIIEAIATGTQPEGLASDALIKTGFPIRWSEQRTLFAAP